MPEDKAREGAANDPEIATPGQALERLGEIKAAAVDRQSRRVGRAAVEVSGEVGYRKLTVELIIARAGASRTGFYQSFANKHHAYLGGYEAGIDELVDRLLGSGRAGENWEAGLHSSLDQLAGFLVDEPDYAGGVLAQVHVAGGAALVKRNEVFERLSRAIDSARRETPASRHSPPPIAADFILSAIEQSVISAIGRKVPEEFAMTVPDLVHLAVSNYFGPEAARLG